jgi:hypothetical protein
VVAAVQRILRESEAEQRAMLRLSLADAPPDPSELRQGRVIGWLTDALEPARPRLGDDQLRWLVLAIRTTLGIETLVWLVDVAGLNRDEAFAQMRWTAFALYRGATS